MSVRIHDFNPIDTWIYFPDIDLLCENISGSQIDNPDIKDLDGFLPFPDLSHLASNIRKRDLEKPSRCSNTPESYALNFAVSKCWRFPGLVCGV